MQNIVEKRLRLTCCVTDDQGTCKYDVNTTKNEENGDRRAMTKERLLVVWPGYKRINVKLRYLPVVTKRSLTLTVFAVNKVNVAFCTKGTMHCVKRRKYWLKTFSLYYP